VATGFFILLFTYAAVSKLLDFENFQVQIAQSPLLSAYAGLVSYAIIIIELLIVVLLAVRKWRLAGLYLSFGLMVAFTVYIYLILNYSDFVPCSCGGILEKMGWEEHMIFNVACVIFACLSIVSTNYYQKPIKILLLSSSKIFVSLLIVSSGIVLILFYSSEYIMNNENNFIRRFPPHPIIEEKAIDLGVNSYYFAGISGDTLYLGNTTSPFQLLKIDTGLSTQKIVKTAIKENYVFKSLQYEIFGDRLYGFDGSIPIIYQGKLQTPEVQLQTLSYKDAYFSQLVVLDSLSFALRTNESGSAKNVLATLILNKKPKVHLAKNLISLKHNNIFESDGKLFYDDSMKNLYYMFYYRNQIVKMDRNLNLVQYGKTIDTIAHSQIKIHNFNNGNIKMINPPNIINRSMLIHKGLIFNRSTLRGRYEPKDLWSQSSIVDIYSTNPIKYWGSFYVQHRSGKSMSHMLVTDKYLFVLIGNDLVRYRITKSLEDEIMGEMPKNHTTE